MNKEQTTFSILIALLSGADPDMSDKEQQQYVDTALALAKKLNQCLKDDDN